MARKCAMRPKTPYRDRNKHRSISEVPLGHLEAWFSLLTALRRAGVCVCVCVCVEQRHARERERWDAGGRRRRGIGEPLASTTDKNRYYEFTAAPRLRGIATITSSVVARVVGARTPVASPAVATVVVVAVEFSCLSAIVCGLSAVSDCRRRIVRFIPHRVIASRTRSAKSIAR